MNSSQGSPGGRGKDVSHGSSASSDAMPEFRDNQQQRDDSQTSGESVVTGQRSGDATQPTDIPNQAANKEKAEGSRENAGGITNRSLDEEQNNQNRVPPRGEAKDGSHA
jgi:hypothetical protein